jgi:DNA-binding transcriptional LysR family regulator
VFVSQPTVSQQLAQLESSLGARLIERDTRRIRLTAAGEALLPYAEQILALVETAAECTRSAAGIADQSLRLGVGHTIATYVLPGLLREYRSRYPERKARITLGNTAQLLAQVDSGEVEVALVGTPAARPGIVITPFLDDRIVAIVSLQHARNQNELAVEELKDETLLVREPGSALHATVEQILGPIALSRDNVLQLGETEAIKRCVESGLGVALVQEIAVAEEVASGKLRVLNLEGVDDRRAYAYAHKANRPLSSAARDLIQLLGGLKPARAAA